MRSVLVPQSPRHLLLSVRRDPVAVLYYSLLPSSEWTDSFRSINVDVRTLHMRAVNRINKPGMNVLNIPEAVLHIMLIHEDLGESIWTEFS